MTYLPIKRFFDVVFSLIGLIATFVPGIAIAATIRLTSPGPAIYWSSRVGRDNRAFLMPKFRTMQIDTPELASHLLEAPKAHITPVGGFLRATSLDEIPQLWSVLLGEMSLVGPRPALHNQSDLIELRTSHGVHKLLPGITGWAQVHGRDELELSTKVKYDAWYAANLSLKTDVLILIRTVTAVLNRRGVSH